MLGPDELPEYCGLPDVGGPGTDVGVVEMRGIGVGAENVVGPESGTGAGLGTMFPVRGCQPEFPGEVLPGPVLPGDDWYTGSP